MTDHEDERRVGLGRVIEDHLAADEPARDEPDDRGVRADDGAPGHDVAAAAEQSFPASDPPTFMSDPATPRERRDAPRDADPGR